MHRVYTEWRKERKKRNKIQIKLSFLAPRYVNWIHTLTHSDRDHCQPNKLGNLTVIHLHFMTNNMTRPISIYPFAACVCLCICIALFLKLRSKRCENGMRKTYKLTIKVIMWCSLSTVDLVRCVFFFVRSLSLDYVNNVSGTVKHHKLKDSADRETLLDIRVCDIENDLTK